MFVNVVDFLIGYSKTRARHPATCMSGDINKNYRNQGLYYLSFQGYGDRFGLVMGLLNYKVDGYGFYSRKGRKKITERSLLQ